jgi:hypothetical protein
MDICTLITIGGTTTIRNLLWRSSVDSNDKLVSLIKNANIMEDDDLKPNNYPQASDKNG